jgi:hypothetical protein
MWALRAFHLLCPAYHPIGLHELTFLQIQRLFYLTLFSLITLTAYILSTFTIGDVPNKQLK